MMINTSTHKPPGRVLGGGRGPAHLRFILGLVLGAGLLLVATTLTMKLPRNTLLLEEELADLLLAHAHPDTRHPEGACPCRESPGGAAVYCRLGLPPDPDSATGGGSSDSFAAGAALVNTTASAATGNAVGDAGDSLPGATPGTGSNSSSSSNSNEPAHHRLAVLIPYRDREKHLEVLLAELRPHLDRQQRAYDVFVVEQADSLLFNRGLLLNAAVQLLQGSAYDYYVFQDVDTIPLEKGAIQYSFPAGPAPLHLTPHWLHPKSNFEDFFGGLVIMTDQQLRRINGFGTQFWGWGREDDNLRERLVQAGMWPPQYPISAKRAGRLSKRTYFKHQEHQQAAELRAADDGGGTVQYFQENPRIPYRGAKIMSSQPHFLRDFETGLNTTMFRVLSIGPFLNATRVSLQLYCNLTATPWCQQQAIGTRHAPAIKHAAAVHAVSGS
ncbi:Beta-1 [Chlorella vulgaris]